jgi:hypothetical protein
MTLSKNIGCSFKFILKVGVEESIVNAPLANLQSKKVNNFNIMPHVGRHF